MRLLLITISCLLAAGTARADQCAWLDDEQATTAQVILQEHPNVLEYCEPCGDEKPGEPFPVKTVHIAIPKPGYKTIVINSEEVDLAYLYIEISPTQYENLALQVGCPAEDVSQSVTPNQNQNPEP